MAQMARFRQPGAAAIAFMNTLAATEARFSARARRARRPCKRQRDAQAGEDQRGGVRDRCLQGGDHREVAGGVDHPVLEPSGIASGGRVCAGRLLSGGLELPRAAGWRHYLACVSCALIPSGA